MNEQRAFYPLYLMSASAPTSQAGTLKPSVTVLADVTATASVQLPGNVQVDNNYVQLQLSNSTAAWAFFNFGKYPNVVASTVATSYPVAPGSVVVVSVDPEVSQISVILTAAATPGNVIITRGEGL